MMLEFWKVTTEGTAPYRRIALLAAAVLACLLLAGCSSASPSEGSGGTGSSGVASVSNASGADPSASANMSGADAGRWHSIAVTSGEDLVEYCPEEAKAGETVYVLTLDVTDVDKVIKVNGQDIGEYRGMAYVFEMPDEDVSIDIVLEDYSFGGGA